MKKHYKIKDFFSSVIFYLAILVFIIGFNFTDSPPPFGWYQQFMPNLGERSITDVFFLDSLTGWAVTNNQNQDSAYVLKTTNSGDNWSIQYRQIIGIGYSGYFRIYFLNQYTGYTCNVLGFYKSTDGGISWTPVWTADTYVDMSILSVDIQWLVSSNSLTGGVFRTTNGGVSWDHQLYLGSLNPDYIYMFNGRIGFIAKYGTGGYVKKTSDGGTSWLTVDSGGFNGFTDMFFIDSLTGWRAISTMKKTTDGGLSWQSQVMPHGGNIITSTVVKFTNVNGDTIWGVGGQIQYPNFQVRGIIYKTTNGGATWGFQLPDTAINISLYPHTKFVNKLNGWAGGSTDVHTVTGGDTVWYMGIQQVSKTIPKDFELKQNYPNPFNPRTVINYKLRVTSYVRLIVYDIIGREVQRLVDQRQRAGEYEVDFMGKFSSTGVYFYRMQVTDEKGNISYSDTKKMILLK